MQNFKEDETGGRDKERYDDERVDPPGWLDGEKLANLRGLRGLKSAISKRCYFVVDALRDF